MIEVTPAQLHIRKRLFFHFVDLGYDYGDSAQLVMILLEMEGQK